MCYSSKASSMSVSYAAFRRFGGDAAAPGGGGASSSSHSDDPAVAAAHAAIDAVAAPLVASGALAPTTAAESGKVRVLFRRACRSGSNAGGGARTA